MNNINFINPELYWVRDDFGHRCYRRNMPSLSTLNLEEKSMAVSSTVDATIGRGPRLGVCGAYFDGDEPPCGGEEENDDYEIIYDDKVNTFSTRIPIAKEYYKHIIGRNAETRRRLESETKVRIEVPKMGLEGDVVISGAKRDAVASCRRRVELLVDSARQRQPYTHFISFPFDSDEIKSKFTDFKKLVLEKCSESHGVDDSVFQSPSRLHLTLGMLVLYSNLERTKAKETLEQCKEEVIVPYLQSVETPLKVSLKGLDYMNDDPSDVHVLYGKVGLDGQDLDVLQTLANRIVDYFVHKNVMTRQRHEAVKLHVTLMNTRYRADDELDDEEGENASRSGPSRTGGYYGQNRHADNYAKREPLDARNILQEFQDYDFGVQELKEVHISVLGGHRADGYKCTAKVDIP